MMMSKKGTWTNISAATTEPYVEPYADFKLAEKVYSGTYDNPFDSPTSLSPSAKLRELKQTGDVCPKPDQPGFWVHVQVDRAGQPRAVRLLVLSDDGQSWSYIETTGMSESRPIDSIPNGGFYLMLY
jgi:hypothetical protein